MAETNEQILRQKLKELALSAQHHLAILAHAETTRQPEDQIDEFSHELLRVKSTHVEAAKSFTRELAELLERL